MSGRIVLEKGAAIPVNIGSRKISKCAVCGNTILYYANGKNIGKYCSSKCRTSCPELRQKISDNLTGKTHSEESRKKMSESHKGVQTGEKNPAWEGDKVGYGAIHEWARRHFGTPSLCEHCGTESAKKFEWANVSKNYIRDRSDWIRLCKGCHLEYDGIRSTRRKPVIQMMEGGAIVKRWECGADISRHFGVFHARISEAILRQTEFEGFFWKFDEIQKERKRHVDEYNKKIGT